MIFGWIRLAVFGFAGLTVVYVLVSAYSRSVRREKLEKRFDAGGVAGTRNAYIAAGMAEYRHGLRRRLIVLVYVVPVVTVLVTIYAVNF